MVNLHRHGDCFLSRRFDLRLGCLGSGARGGIGVSIDWIVAHSSPANQGHCSDKA